MWQNGYYVFKKYNFLSCQSVQNDVKIYFEFCTMFGLKQLIETPAQIVVVPLSSNILQQASTSEQDNDRY